MDTKTILFEESQTDPVKLSKTGKDRLKIKINFTAEKEKPVIPAKEINKNPKSFEESFILGDKVGEGAHAVVRKCWRRSNNEEKQTIYAVKIFRSGDPEIVTTIKKTYSNVRFLSHPSVGAAFELYINQKTETSYLVMEYCAYPTLQSLLEKKQRLNENQIVLIAREVIQAVEYIHTKGICHRDIKPDNILYEHRERLIPEKQSPVKLVDFGVSKRFLQIQPGQVGAQIVNMWTRTGNVNYCAPEILKACGYDASIDLWAVGIVIYQCLTGKLPFNETYIMDTIDSICCDNQALHFQDEYFKNASKHLQDLIKQLLQVNPKKRIKAKDALSHPFILLHISVGNRGVRDDQHLNQPNKNQTNSDSLTQSSNVNNLQSFSHEGFKKNQESKEIQRHISEKEGDEFKDKLNLFLEGNQLTIINYVRKPETNDMNNIDLVSSFNTYQIKAQNNNNSNSNESSQNKGNNILSFLGKLSDSNNVDYDTKKRPCSDQFDQLFQTNLQTSLVIPEEKKEEIKTISTFEELGLGQYLNCQVQEEEIFPN